MRGPCLLLCACGLAGVLPGAAASPAPALAAPAGGAHGCLPGGNGYLRARIRGAMNLDIDWHDAEIECDGGPRPDGSGLRVSSARPRAAGRRSSPASRCRPGADGRRLRLVFGVGSVHEGRTGRALPTNLTVIFEGEERVFATRGEDHCTVDELRQERLGALGGPLRSWRIVARGFCTSPASTLNSDARILVSRFDFAGSAVFTDEPRERPTQPET